MKRVGIFFLLLFCWGAVATEIDDTSSYYLKIADSEEYLNFRVQELFDQSLSEYSGCKAKVFLWQLEKHLLGNLFYGVVETFANDSSSIPKIPSEVGDSIYKGTPFETSIVGRFFGLGPVISINGHHIGTDKLSHFLDNGNELFRNYRADHSLIELLEITRGEEEGMLGYTTTGVKSYGDISADVDGFRFWSQLIGDNIKDPYFVCENNKLKQVRQFRWSDYVTAAWTEAINCSEYSSPDYALAMNKNEELLESQNDVRFHCPIEPPKCDGLRALYTSYFPGENIAMIISPLCR